MVGNIAWQELYKAALLELRAEELQLRINAAEQAIHERIAELKRSDIDPGEEQYAIADALRSLRILSETECKLQPSSEACVSRSEEAI
jgi:hypothetical protein